MGSTVSGGEHRSEDRALRPLGDVLDGVLRDLGEGETARLMRIRDAWPEIAGDRWKETTRPVTITADALVVEVPDGATASVARFETAGLVERIRHVVPGVGIATIRFRVATARFRVATAGSRSRSRLGSGARGLEM